MVNRIVNPVDGIRVIVKRFVIRWFFRCHVGVIRVMTCGCVGGAPMNEGFIASHGGPGFGIGSPLVCGRIIVCGRIMSANRPGHGSSRAISGLGNPISRGLSSIESAVAYIANSTAYSGRCPTSRIRIPGRFHIQIVRIHIMACCRIGGTSMNQVFVASHGGPGFSIGGVLIGGRIIICSGTRGPNRSGDGRCCPIPCLRNPVSYRLSSVDGAVAYIANSTSYPGGHSASGRGS
jgi:hypothetical protein